jgi:hypothetical protein
MEEEWGGDKSCGVYVSPLGSYTCLGGKQNCWK